MEDRKKINEDMTMKSPLNKIGMHPYVNVYGDSVFRLESEGPLMLSPEMCEELVKDIENIGVRIQLGEEPTLFERIMIGLLKDSY